MNTPRIRRPIPQRTAPLRDLRGAWRGPDAPAAPPSDAPAAPPPEATAGVAERSVDTAYRVLEDQLRQGRDAARRWQSAADDPVTGRGSPGDDLARLWADAAHALFDVLAGVTRSVTSRGSAPVAPRREAPPEPPAPPAPVEPPPTPTTATPTAVALLLHASVPIEVELDLHVSPAHGVIAGDLLPLDDPSRPSLTSAAVERVGDGLRVRLAVPAGQPAGVYAGIVHDAVSGAACGRLRVVVHA